MLELTLERIVAVVAWLIANAAYLDFRRRDEHGLKRLVAFWIGFPATLATFLAVEDGSQPRIRDDDADLEELFDEVRRDRRLRDVREGE